MDTEMQDASTVGETDLVVQKEEDNGERSVELHPLVIMNVADHYTRLKCAGSVDVGDGDGVSNDRVLGILFGVQDGLNVSVYDSFEFKYQVVNKNIEIDREFAQSRIGQMSQVFPGFELLGWYSVGSHVRQSDLAIHRLILEFNESPLYLLMNPETTTNQEKKKLPIEMFESKLHVLNQIPTMLFVRTSFKIETSETEKLAVDHISKVAPQGAANRSSLHNYLGNIRDAVKMLDRQVNTLITVLVAMQKGEIPMDYNLARQISSVCNQLPAFDAAAFDKTFTTEYNDSLLIGYLAAVTKGAADTNTIIDRFNLTRDRHSRGTLI